MRKIFTFLLVIATNACLSQWSSSSTVNTAVCTSVTGQQASRMVSDGNGGAIITWWDYDAASSDYDIYAQRINANGNIEWTATGVVVCGNALHQQNPEMTSDGNGGAIIVWQDNRSGTCEIYAQRINASGIVQWTADGVSVGNATNCQTFPQVISDGSGGAFVTWKDLRNGSSYRIYTQRINGNGINQWGAGGVSMSAGTNNQGEPQLISDGNGGVIVSWQEYIGAGPTAQYDIYAQRVNASGVNQWGLNGSLLCAAPNFQLYTKLTTDGSNGAIVVWQDSRSGSGNNTYAQKVNGAGVIQWVVDGIALGPAGVTQTGLRIMTDGSGGAFVTWRNGNNQIYGQHIATAGNLLWGATGLQIISQTGAIDPQLITDGGTGTIITWCDYRAPNAPNIFAQHLNAAGSFLWAASGVNISTALDGQVAPQMIEGAGGTGIICWMDYRNNSTVSDIYASRFNADGTLSSVILPVTLLHFEAKKINNTIQLLWQTASEQNNHYFNIERSSDGRQFNTIGKVNAAGNSQSIKNYDYTDSSPLKQVNYYRLKQADIDGKFVYSPVIKILNDRGKALFGISPNPAKQFINISYSGKKETVEIRIYDARGILVKEQKLKNEFAIRLDVNNLRPGMYFIRLSDGTSTEDEKFIKQ